MLVEMITREFYSCPVCGRPHAYYPLEYYWCPYCGSNLKQQIKLICREKITILKEGIKTN